MDDVKQSIDNSSLDKVTLKKEADDLKKLMDDLKKLIDEYKQDADNSEETIEEIRDRIDGIIGVMSKQETIEETDNTIIENINLQRISTQYNQIPTLNQETTINLKIDKDIEPIKCSVASEPIGSNIVIDSSNNGKNISFTPIVKGDYQIVATCTNSISKKTIKFTVEPIFPFDELKIKGNNGTIDITTLVSYITNQSWISSQELTETELRALVSSYNSLEVVGYHSSRKRLLVQYDNSKIQDIENIFKEIRKNSKISMIYHRIYEGENADREDVIEPNDDENDEFDDGGANWHLEKIKITEAWDYTLGSTRIKIGVSDSSFNTNHEDFSDTRPTTTLTNRDRECRIDDQGVEHCTSHGTAVASAIGADTNNGMGISGINWYSSLILGSFSVKNVRAIMSNLSDNRVASLVSRSGAIPNKPLGRNHPEPSERFNYDEPEDRANDVFDITRTYRDLFNTNSNILLVNSAGNGIAKGGFRRPNGSIVYGIDGKFHSPSLHYKLNDDGEVELSKQPNVIFVAAMQDDERLACYSNYGESIDIAAPTAFKTFGLEDDEYLISNDYGKNTGEQAFNGTSAATPVVSGVASLIYSINPNFTGAEVKDILIKSADEYVTERYKEWGDANKDTTDDDENDNIELLSVHGAPEIPILNAKRAIEMAIKQANCFPDITEEDDTEERIAICHLKKDGIVKGYGDDIDTAEYRMDNPISRPEFLKIAIKTAIGDIEESDIEHVFSDVDYTKENGEDEHWYVKYVNYAFTQDIAHGYDTNNDGNYDSFGIGKDIQFDEALKMILKAFSVALRGEEEGEDWQVRYREIMTTEFPTIKLLPNETIITRGYMAYLVYNISEQINIDNEKLNDIAKLAKEEQKIEVDERARVISLSTIPKNIILGKEFMIRANIDQNVNKVRFKLDDGTWNDSLAWLDNDWKLINNEEESEFWRIVYTQGITKRTKVEVDINGDGIIDNSIFIDVTEETTGDTNTDETETETETTDTNTEEDIAVPVISNMYDITPDTGTAGSTNFTFKVDLSSDIPDGYGVYLNFDNLAGDWFRQIDAGGHVPMVCSGSVCQLTTSISKAGNRSVRAGLFKGDALQGNYYDDQYFTVSEAEPIVTNITPSTVTLNQETTFSIIGKNLTDEVSFFIDECINPVSLGGTATLVKFKCTPSYKTGSHWGVVKDVSGGDTLYNFDINFQ